MAQPMSPGRASKARGTGCIPHSQSIDGVSTTEERRRHRVRKQMGTENIFRRCAECGRAMPFLCLSLMELCGQSFLLPSSSRFGNRLLSWRGCWSLTPQPAQAVPALPSPDVAYLPPSSFLITGTLLAPDKPALTVCPLRTYSYAFSLLSLHRDTTVHNIME